ncbi:putative alpha/beta hydrolase [Trichoderma atroviride IMI 206040]|uniref:Alpha/beta hydrolase n=1 Tax=Hypocrea atroviridis (strain ATCC 20476 / IMI 206040) TaxID=452589 RepID=G9NKJ7_HYPAI|nr:putative alpha/beta hydrolase [Trichoderma atroviride IMI 206040]EHK48420.1 putative alpha/beta hydrolase [Trichoderma atroviride IMI 206040]
MAEHAKTKLVPHLGGIDVGYRHSFTDSSLPTLVLINPFTTTSDYYQPEFESERLASKFNLLAIEPLGHGATRTKSETFTYWDSAIMNIQLLDVLGVNQVFVAGTSQGGWIAARMALLSPQTINGIILIGTSMDSESPESRELGYWNGPQATSTLVAKSADLTPHDNFEPGSGYVGFLMSIGYGEKVTADLTQKWFESIQNAYSGDDGKKLICMAAVCLASRDGLYARLPHIRCPVLWMQGTNDVVFSVANAEKEVRMFTNAPEAKLVVMEGGVHFLSFTHGQELEKIILEFIRKWMAKPRGEDFD